MFSKFLRKILVIAFQIVVLGMMLCLPGMPALAAAPAGGSLAAVSIEQVRVEMPEIRVYVRGPGETGAPEAYLDGQALASRGTQTLDEKGTSYLVMLDVSGSIQPDYFISAKKQVLALAQSLHAEDRLTLITFGDMVTMQLSDCRDAAQVEAVLNGLEARDQNTHLYEAFSQCLKYAQSTAQEARQVVLVVSDGIQDTGSVGITQKEIEEQLTQANLPVYSFCVNQADPKAQEEFGTFARTTGGEFYTFGPSDAEEVWQDWRSDLEQVQILCFESTTNHIDGELHTLLLKTTADGKIESDTRQVRFTNWITDTTPPEVTSLVYDKTQNTLTLQFSEPVVGAEDAGTYQLRRGEKTEPIKGVVQENAQQYRLLLPENLSFGTYTLVLTGIRDDSMEQNPLTRTEFSFEKPFGFRDALPWAAGGVVLLLAVVGVVFWKRRPKPQPPEETLARKVEYEVQHVITMPKPAVDSPAEGTRMARMTMEVLSGAQTGQQFECAVHKSAIWGRSREMCDVTFEDPRISRQHCVFEVQENAVLLTDLGSQNGTYVNGIRVQQAQLLHPGDTVQLGDTVLRIAKIWV